jgi:phosphopantetheinyl transferase
MTNVRIDAWVLPVVCGAAEEPAFVAVVGPEDTEKIVRLGRACDRDRAVSARVAARTAIGRRLGIAAADVPLVGDDRRWIADTDMTVSWSHSGDWIALAIAQDLPVGIDIEKVPNRLDLSALSEIGVASLEEFVGLEAASKATGCVYAPSWPPDVTVRRLAAPQQYVAAVAAPGDEWNVELHMRSPLEEWIVS